MKKSHNEKESYDKDSNRGERVTSNCSIHPFSHRFTGGMIHGIAGGLWTWSRRVFGSLYPVCARRERVGSVNKVGNDPGKGGRLYQLLRLENIQS